MPVRRRPLLVAAALALLACEGSPTEGSIDIDGPTLEALGDQVQLPATLPGSSAPAKWRSLNPTIVSVTSGGLAKAIGHGQALLEATAGSRQAETILTVLPPTLVKIDSLKVSPLVSGGELVALRVFNSGGRGTYRLEAWGYDGTGGHVRYLETDWYPAPVGMNDVTLYEVDTPTNGIQSYIHWLMVEYQPATYQESERRCVDLKRELIICPMLPP
ncbi:MAG TPA: hypothetical protein VFQ45_13965 [Longimicrobium sp.]|nr:hypothetical protein [Longimicrobium sp.]